MAATFTVAIAVPFQCPTRDVELAVIEQALDVCAQQSRSAGGQVLSGVILGDDMQQLGTYTYTPLAPA